MRGVVAIAAAQFALLVAVAGRYGYHRDELYFVAAGRHPALGYADQPPLTPLVARAMTAIDAESLVLLRIPAALAAAALVVVTGLLARELGGGRAAQCLAAAAAATSALVLGAGHLLGTTIFDLLVWAVVSLLVVRLIGGADQRWRSAVGAVVGLGLLNKVLPLFLVAALTVSLVAAGPRELLRCRWFWLGGLLALAIWAPTLWWQADNGWPQLELSRSIAAGESGTSNTAAEFIGTQFGLTGVFGVLLWAPGLRLLWQRRELRCFPLAFALLFVTFLATGGKSYYLGGMYPILLAAGAIPVTSWLGRARWRPPAAVAIVILNGAGSAYLFLPIIPAADLPDSPVLAINYDAGETVGWPAFAEYIVHVRDSLPADDQVGVLAANYGEAGAVEHYTRLPIYSGHNSYWWWGPPPDDMRTMVAVGLDRDRLSTIFARCTDAGRFDNGQGVENDEHGVRVYVCRDPRASWQALWPQLKQLG